MLILLFHQWVCHCVCFTFTFLYVWMYIYFPAAEVSVCDCLAAGSDAAPNSVLPVRITKYIWIEFNFYYLHLSMHCRFSRIIISFLNVRCWNNLSRCVFLHFSKCKHFQLFLFLSLTLSDSTRVSRRRAFFWQLLLFSSSSSLRYVSPCWIWLSSSRALVKPVFSSETMHCNWGAGGQTFVTWIWNDFTKVKTLWILTSKTQVWGHLWFRSTWKLEWNTAAQTDGPENREGPFTTRPHGFNLIRFVLLHTYIILYYIRG